MNFGLRQSDETGAVDFQGRLTAECLENVRSIMMMLMANSNRIILNFDKVTEVSPVCLELICMSTRTSLGLKKTVTVRGKYLRVMKKQIIHDGKACMKSCAQTADRQCLMLQMSEGVL